MTSISENLEAIRPTEGRARARLIQIRSMWGLLEIAELDALGPTLVVLHVPQRDGSAHPLRWRRVEGSGRTDPLFERTED